MCVPETRSGSSAAFLVSILIAMLAATTSGASAVENHGALLLWSAVPDAAGYLVYVRQDGDIYAPPIDVDPRSPDADGLMSVVLPSLALADETYFRVSSYDARGVESDMSNEISLDRATVLAAADPYGGVDPPPTATPPEANPPSLGLPQSGWGIASGDGAFGLEGGLLVGVSQSTTRPLELRNPQAGSLDSPLSVVEFHFHGDASTQLSAVVRIANGDWRELFYLLESGPIRLRGKRGYIPVGAGFGPRTLRRDLATDVREVFGAEFFRLEQVGLRGSIELSAVTLHESSGDPHPVPRIVMVPVAEWSLLARASPGPIAADDIGAVALASDGRRRLTFPPRRLGRLVAPFERIAFLVRDETPDFAVHVRVETSRRRHRLLSFGTTRRNSQPLGLRESPGSPYRTALLDVSQGLEAVSPGEEIESIRQIRFAGGFEITGVRLVESLE